MKIEVDYEEIICKAFNQLANEDFPLAMALVTFITQSIAALTEEGKEDECLEAMISQMRKTWPEVKQLVVLEEEKLKCDTD